MFASGIFRRVTHNKAIVPCSKEKTSSVRYFMYKAQSSEISARARASFAIASNCPSSRHSRYLELTVQAIIPTIIHHCQL